MNMQTNDPETIGNLAKFILHGFNLLKLCDPVTRHVVRVNKNLES